VELGLEHRAPREEGALRVRDHRPCVPACIGDPLEEVVEGADRAAQERGLPREQLALDRVDVRPVRHDEHRLPIEGGQIAVEEASDLARVRRAGDETERHRSIVERGPDDSRRASGTRPQRAETRYEAGVEADFGRRPRRAAGWPGLASAHSPQRSACFAPRRASEYVIRITAPRASSTSLPQLSQTRIVLRAMREMLAEIAGNHAAARA